MTAPGEAHPIRISAVTHRYGGRIALDDLTLELSGGRLVGLVGPDGVGKSTVLGLVAGATKLQTGRIEVLGGSIANALHRRRVSPAIAYMPQGLGRNLYAELSVRENLEFFSRLFGQGAEERGMRVETLLAATGLAAFSDRLMGKLSGGMKQKLGLCCALIHDPDLLVLDEPTTGVDPLSRRQFWALIDAIRAQSPRLTVLVSTAYMDEAERFDQIVAMDAGRVLFQGSPAELTGDAGSLAEAYGQLRGDSSATHAAAKPLRDTGGEPVIVAEGLTKRFGDFTAVDRVDFTIRRGEIFGFLGSNGCGKSTTMKMLTGLLPASEGEALIFGETASVRARHRSSRREIGYMSQAFSLYGELTVGQNLRLHARIFGLTDEAERISALTTRFGLSAHIDTLADSLPLGIKQRLSLAVAIIHRPRLLILDEPTSGVDPEARDAFWKLLVELSREEGVTIFVSTHFMAEAERCDRVSFMHAGRVLAEGSPAELTASQGARTLEEAFISVLEAAERPEPVRAPKAPAERARAQSFGLGRVWAYARRETIDVLRDSVRLAFAFLGSALLMLVFCFGITLDIEELDFAVFDLSQGPESRAYIAELEGSRYFKPTAPLVSAEDGARRLTRGDVALVVELPPDFGRKLRTGEATEVLATVDGAIPFKGETVEGYAAGVHQSFLERAAREAGRRPEEFARIEPRFRYNQSFESIAAMAPAMPAILLAWLPSVLAAVSVARERELGSVTNFYVTPTTRIEFLVGKQLPYIAVAFINFLMLTAMILLVFGVPLKGDPLPLALGALLYVWASTSFGLLIATMTSTQVAAVFATTIVSIIPTIQFSGLMQPVSTLEPGAQAIGALWHASHFLHLNVGAFTKELGWTALAPDILALACFGPALTLIAAMSLRSQAR